MIAITGASGQLGRLVIQALLTKVPAQELVAIVRNPKKVEDFSAKGVVVRTANYSDRNALTAALKGVDKLLLISSSEVGQRVDQHRNVIQAAQEAGIKLLAYTSLLHADTSPLGLAAEHLATEQLIKASGLAYVLLRNGWYTENYTAGVASAVANKALAGSAGDGLIASASRADYADAAATVLNHPNPAGKVYELAGDNAYTLSELAAEISLQSGQQIPYINLPEAEYQALLTNAGLPEPIAKLLADSDVGAAKGGLFDDSQTLSQLIGRPTTSLSASVKAALA